MISIPASTKLCDKICMTLGTIVLICVIAHRCGSKNFVPALIHCSGVGMGWGAGSWELAHPLILHSFFYVCRYAIVKRAITIGVPHLKATSCVTVLHSFSVVSSISIIAENK